MNGKCACWTGWLGVDCTIPTPCFQACSNVCEADGKSEKCLYCVGQCRTIKDSPTIGQHDPFEDLHDTFLLQAPNATSPRRPHREIYAEDLEPPVHHLVHHEVLLQDSTQRTHHKEVYVADVPVSEPLHVEGPIHVAHREVSVVDLTGSFF